LAGAVLDAAFGGRPTGRFAGAWAATDFRGLPTGRFAGAGAADLRGRPTGRFAGAPDAAFGGLPTGRFAGALVGADGAADDGVVDIAARMVRSVSSRRAASTSTRLRAARVAVSASASERLDWRFCFFPGMIEATLP
jgi:hypothetical protein